MKNHLTKLGAIALVTALSFAAHAASDGAVVTVLRTANDMEIDAGQMAKKKATNAEVKSFAQMMIDAHKASNKKTGEIAKKNNIKPESDPEAVAIKKDEKEKMKSWKNVSGADFDKMYIDNQIEMHKSLISKMDSDFIPNARNTELKSHLEMTRDHVQEHLAKAQEIQTALQTAQQ